MGSSSSKRALTIRRQERSDSEYRISEIINPLIVTFFNEKIKIQAVYILIRNHQLFIHNKVRSILVRYLTLQKNIPPSLFNRLACILDYVNELITEYYLQFPEQFQYPDTEITQYPPPSYRAE